MRSDRLVVLGLMALPAAWVVAGMADTQVTAPKALPRVLYMTECKGFVHGSVKISRRIVPELGLRTRAFVVDVSEDSSDINAANLENYQALVFYTSGELPMSDQDKQAMMDWIKAGHGFVGIHSANDTFYKWDEYGEMLGGYFDGHPWTQEVRIKLEDPDHWACNLIPNPWVIKDEIYQHKQWSRERIHVVMSLDNSSVNVNKSKHKVKDFPIAWCKLHGKGRVFYTGLGHFDEVWRNHKFQRHLANGIRWALGLVPGDATPSAELGKGPASSDAAQ